MPLRLGDAVMAPIEPHPEWEHLFRQHQVHGATWHLDNPAQADWLMRRAARSRANIEEVTAAVEAEIRALRYYLDLELQADRDEVFVAEDLIATWAQAQPIPEDRTTVTRRSLFGSVTRRRLEPKVTVTDEVAALAWVRSTSNIPMIQTCIKKTPDKLAWGELKKVVQVREDGVYSPDTGEKIPGLTVEAQEDKVTVAPAGATAE